MQDRLDPLTIAAASFVLAAFAGVAALLRSSQELTVRAVLAVVLNSGLLGLAAALLLFSFFKDNAYFLVGLCVLAGLGGLTVLGFVLQVIRQGGIAINITTTKPEEDGDVNDQA